MGIGKSIKEHIKGSWCKLCDACNNDKSHHSIALALSIGIFFGLSPFLGIRAILAFITAWIFRVNRLIAAICAAMHEIFLPFLPLLLYWEHEVGRFIFRSKPHTHTFLAHNPGGHIGFLKQLAREGGAVIAGGFVIGFIAASIAYFILRFVIARGKSNNR